jgi:hypothetical protein
VDSNPKAVYLTDSYAIHFAQNAVEGSKDRLALIEIDTDLLDEGNLAPDEDFLEQATRSDPKFEHVHKRWPTDIKKRTIWFRARQHSDFAHTWSLSMKHMGTCCHMGVVPADAIKRVALLPASSSVSFASDPTITLINYMIMGAYYRNLMRYVFDGTVQSDLPTDPFDLIGAIAKLSREYVEIRELRKVVA